MRQWALLREVYGFLLGNGVLQPRGFDDRTNSDIHRRQYPCLGTVQKFKTGVNGAFAAIRTAATSLSNLVMSLRSAYRTGAVWQ